MKKYIAYVEPHTGGLMGYQHFTSDLALKEIYEKYSDEELAKKLNMYFDGEEYGETLTIEPIYNWEII